MLSDGRIDIVIGGLAITPVSALNATFTDSYLYHTIGVIVRDKFRDEYGSLEYMNEKVDLKLAVIKNDYYSQLARKQFPNAEIIEVSNPRDFFKGKHKEADAFVYPNEAGSAWSLLYPQYTVVVPKGLKLKVPAAFKLPKDQLAFAAYLNTWLELKKDNGFMDKVYQYWILGKDPEKEEPRWSVVRNVFGWDM